MGCFKLTYNHYLTIEKPVCNRFHLGNVHVVVSDKKLALDSNNDGIIDGYISNLVAANDYFAFGMTMPGRHSNSDAYNYGYQGSEKDDELKGEGNSYVTHYRMLDPRLGRWFSPDPLEHEQPWQSPYCSMDNNPIWHNDVLGDKIRNGDKEIAEHKDKELKTANENLSEFKKNNNINDETKRKDFLKQGGSKAQWKEFKNLKENAKNAKQSSDYWNAQASKTQGIIDNWSKTSPNLFKEVDSKSIDFILFSSKDAELESGGSFGLNKISTLGESTTLVSNNGNGLTKNALSIYIHSNVNLSTPDIETGEYSLNHEAGHFLYIIKFTSEYVEYINKQNINKIDNEGGHHKNDESGKVSHKLGQVKDIPSGPYEIKSNGN